MGVFYLRAYGGAHAHVKSIHYYPPLLKWLMGLNGASRIYICFYFNCS